MNLKVEILKVETKEIKTIVQEIQEYFEWQWTEGNYSCDCNRKIFFDDIGYQEDVDCSEGLYLVRLSDNDTAEVLYDEIKEIK